MYDDKSLQVLQNIDHFNIINTRFPHIGKKITLLWGYKEFVVYMNTLLTETRGDTRQGFPPNVGSALLNLLHIHDTLYPQHMIKTDKWGFSYG